MLLSGHKGELPLLYDGMGSSAERWFDYATEMGGYGSPELRDMTELIDFGRNRKFVSSSSPERDTRESAVEAKPPLRAYGAHRAPTPLAGGGRSRFRNRFAHGPVDADRRSDSSEAESGGSPTAAAAHGPLVAPHGSIPKRVVLRVERTFFDLIFKSARCTVGLPEIAKCVRGYPALDLEQYMGAASLTFKRFCRAYFTRGTLWDGAGTEPDNRQRIAIRRGFVVDTILTANLKADDESSNYYEAGSEEHGGEYVEQALVDGHPLVDGEDVYEGYGGHAFAHPACHASESGDPVPCDARPQAHPFPGHSPGLAGRRGRSAGYLQSGCWSGDGSQSAATACTQFPMRYHSRAGRDKAAARSLSHSGVPRSPSLEVLDQVGEWLQVQERGGQVYFHNTATGQSQWDADGTPFTYELCDDEAGFELPPHCRSTTPPPTAATLTTTSPSQFGDGVSSRLQKCDDILPPPYSGPPPPPRGTSVSRAVSMRSRSMLSTDVTTTHRSSMPPEELSFRDAAEARRPASYRATPCSTGRPPVHTGAPGESHQVGRNGIYIKPLNLAVCRHPLPWDYGSPYVYPSTYRSTTLDAAETHRTPGLLPEEHKGGSAPRLTAGGLQWADTATPDIRPLRPGGYDTYSVDTDSFAELEREIDRQEKKTQEAVPPPPPPQPPLQGASQPRAQQHSSSPEGTLATTSGGVDGGLTDEASSECTNPPPPVKTHQPYAASPPPQHATHYTQRSAGTASGPLIGGFGEHGSATFREGVPGAWGLAGAHYAEAFDPHTPHPPNTAPAGRRGSWPGSYACSPAPSIPPHRCAHTARSPSPAHPHPHPQLADLPLPVATQAARPATPRGAGRASPPITVATGTGSSSSSETDSDGDEYDEYETDGSEGRARRGAAGLAPTRLDLDRADDDGEAREAARRRRGGSQRQGSQASQQSAANTGRRGGSRRGSQGRRDGEDGECEPGERRRRRRKKKKNPEKEKERKRQKKQRRRRLLRQQQYQSQLESARRREEEAGGAPADTAPTLTPEPRTASPEASGREHAVTAHPLAERGASHANVLNNAAQRPPPQKLQPRATPPPPPQPLVAVRRPFKTTTTSTLLQTQSEDEESEDSDDWMFEMRARRGMPKYIGARGEWREKILRLAATPTHTEKEKEKEKPRAAAPHPRRFLQHESSSESSCEDDEPSAVGPLGDVSPGLPSHLPRGGTEVAPMQHPFAEYGVGDQDSARRRGGRIA